MAPPQPSAGGLSSAGLTHRICFLICTQKTNFPDDPLPRASPVRAAFVRRLLLLASWEMSREGEEREVVWVGRGPGELAANEEALNGPIVLLFI